MKTEDLHPIQSEILCELLFVTEASFSELNKKKLGSDQFSFHLRQLTDWKLIEKNADGKYGLTTKGKEYANRFDTEQKEVERQPKIGVLVVGIRQVNNVTEYLVSHRLKQPYYGFWGFVTGKIRWGETVLEAAGRELREETGLSGKVKMMGVKHKMDYDESGKLLEDKFFLVIKAWDLAGNLMDKFEGGENQWMTKDEILNLPDLFDGVLESIKLIDEKEIKFMEDKYKVKKY